MIKAVLWLVNIPVAYGCIKKKAVGDLPSTNYKLDAISTSATPQTSPDDCCGEPDDIGAAVERRDISGVGAV